MTKRLKTLIYSLIFLNIVIFLVSVLYIPKLFKFSILFSVFSIVIMYLCLSDKKILKILILYSIILLFEFFLIGVVPAISISIVISIIIFPTACGMLGLKNYYVKKRV